MALPNIAPPPPSVLDAFDLSPERREIARITDRNVLVLAGPGAGKSHLLSAHAAWLAEQRLGRVVVLTFSRLAANEMASRLSRILTRPEANRLVVAKPLHAYALDLLRVHGYLIGLPSALETVDVRDVDAMGEEVATSMGIEPEDRASSELGRYHHRLLWQDLGSPPTDTARWIEAIVERMRRTGKLDWDSCLRFMIELLEGHPQVKQSIQHHDRYFLVDHAEDCDALQRLFLDLVSGGPQGAHLFLTMDPDQSIYGFRDADPRGVLRWARSYHPVEFELPESRRCSPRIQELARRVIGRSSPGYTWDGGAWFHRVADRAEEARLVYTKIREWAEIEGRVSIGKIAVLARAPHHLQVIRSWLAEQGMPVRSAPRKEWSTEEELALLALHFIAEWSEGADPTPATSRFLEQILSLDMESVQAIEREAFARACHPGDIVTDSRWIALRDRAATDRITPAVLVADVASTFAVELDEASSLPRLATESRSLRDLLRRARHGPKRDAVVSTEGVLVTTFHAAKGLEFDAVFIVACEDGIIPDFRAKTEEQLLEERRALNVALTRAARLLVVTSVERDRGWSKSPSRFLPPASDPIWSIPEVF